jgi:hypothetical protein
LTLDFQSLAAFPNLKDSFSDEKIQLIRDKKELKVSIKFHFLKLPPGTPHRTRLLCLNYQLLFIVMQFCFSFSLSSNNIPILLLVLSVVDTVTEESTDYFSTLDWALKISNDYFATRYLAL